MASTLLLRESGTLDGSSQAVLPLHGVTFAVKDNMDVVGRRTGAGSPAWLATRGKDPAVKNAHVVALLLKSGAVFVGKTQMDELACVTGRERALRHANQPGVAEPNPGWLFKRKRRRRRG